MMKRLSTTLLTLLILSSCSHSPQAPGICLSFDDRSIHEWDAIRPLLNKYDAHVTFFITQYDSLDDEEQQLLKDFETDGHEIGSHGALHVLSETYIKEHSYNEYFEKEIDNNIATLKEHGFNPTSFAYPYGAKYWFTDYLLLKRFQVVRGISPLTEPIEENDDIFYDFDNDRTLSALGIDNEITIEKLQRALDRATERSEVIMLYGHVPGNGADNSFDTKLLEEILKSAKEKGMKFYRVKDLVTSD